MLEVIQAFCHMCFRNTLVIKSSVIYEIITSNSGSMMVLGYRGSRHFSIGISFYAGYSTYSCLLLNPSAASSIYLM